VVRLAAQEGHRAIELLDQQQARQMIDSMFSDKTTPVQREEIRSKMMSAPQYVMVSAFEGMFAMEAPKPVSIPQMASSTPGGTP
jgi:hypothetical protein